MRIALVSPGFPPDLGGVEVVVAGLARGFRAQGCDVTVFAIGERRTSETRPDGTRVERFPAVSVARYSFSIALDRELRRVAGDFDVVHFHNYHWLQTLVTPARIKSPYVFSPHYHGRGRSKASTAVERTLRPWGLRVLNGASSIVAVSRAEQDRLVESFALTGVTVIPNGVELPDNPPVDQPGSAPVKREPATILSVGRLERYKRTDVVIEALTELPSEYRLEVVGEGPALPALRRLADERGLATRVHFNGRIDDAELQSLRASSGIGISLSLNEAFGLTAAESISAGLPTILSDIPAHRDLAEQAGDLAVLISDCAPRQLASVIGAAGARVPAQPSRRFADWTQVAAEWLAVYASCAP